MNTLPKASQKQKTWGHTSFQLQTMSQICATCQLLGCCWQQIGQPLSSVQTSLEGLTLLCMLLQVTTEGGETVSVPIHSYRMLQSAVAQ